MRDERPVIRETLEGAGVGAAAGFAIGLIGELAVYLTLRLFPTDVAIVGFAVYGAVMAGVVVGAFCGWLGWVRDPLRRAFVSAAPGVLVGTFAVFMQWSAV